MYGISISLVSILMIIIALSSGFLGNISIFPFLTKAYLFRNILVISFIFVVFVESYFLYRHEKAITKKPDTKPIRSILHSALLNFIQSIYLTLLIAPFIAVCNVFLSVESIDIVRPMIVFLVFVIIFRINVLLLSRLNLSYERFIRIIIILTFAIPLLAFCLWEFSEFPETILSYISPVWFLIEILRGRIQNLIPFVVIWLIPTVSLILMFILKSRKVESIDGRTES